MIWVDRVVNKIIKSGKHKPYWVDDMKTPSGRIHIGSLRGVALHDIVYKALLDRGVEATFSYVFEDHDPMDALPVYLDKNKWSQYLGQPLFTIPSPDGKADNYACYFASEFKEVFNRIGCNPRIIWMSKIYQEGKMNKGIKLCLDKVNIIRGIYEEVYHKKIPPNWFPLHVVCPKCGKESTTKVIGWDGEKVDFLCDVKAVDWTNGCGTRDKVSPFSSKGKYAGKLLWKVEWAVKWQAIGITIEGAGKDHMTAGGSHDVASLVCQKVLNYPVPYGFSHEFFLVAGRKMSSSKGLGTSAKEIAEMLPPELLRFLIIRARVNQPINFDPKGMTIPDLFDEFDRCAQAYWKKSDKDLARIFELSQIDEKYKKKIFLPRFRTIVNHLQISTEDIIKKFAGYKKTPLAETEKEILCERILYSKKWLESYAPRKFIQIVVPNLPKNANNLSRDQRQYLQSLKKMVEIEQEPERLQKLMYQKIKEMDISVKEAFEAIYLVFLGKPYGPKAAWFLLSLDPKIVEKRLTEVENAGKNSNNR